MARIVQSTLVPAQLTDWLTLLRDDAQVIALAGQAPTLAVRFSGEDGPVPLFCRHQLVFGLFRTTWTSRVEEWAPEHGFFACSLKDGLFAKFRHVLRVDASSEGLIVRSELEWEGAGPSLEDLLQRSLLRYPVPQGQAIRFQDRTTTRLQVDGRASGAA